VTYIQSRHATLDGYAYAIALNPLGGNVGIGTTVPGAKLDISQASGSTAMRVTNGSAIDFGNDIYMRENTDWNGGLDITNWNFAAPNRPKVTAGAFQGTGATLTNYFAGNVGIGTTNPQAKLHVLGNFTVGDFNTNNIIQLGVTAYGPSNPFIYLGSYNSSNVFEPTITIQGSGNRNVGIGTTSPGQKLDVAGGYARSDTGFCIGASCITSWPSGAVTSVFGRTGAVVAASGDYSFSQISGSVTDAQVPDTITASNYYLATNPSGYITAGVTALTASTVTFGGGTGKINAGTVDPIYTIGGVKYATYLPGMTGQKEETTGVATLRLRGQTQTDAEIYGYTIDFNNLEKGSDLWLFSKVTDLKNNFDKMTVLLTPAFDGRVWYEKDSKNLRLTIYAELLDSRFYILNSSPEVSYRLTAPRFDAAQWPNTSADPSSGFIIDE